MWFLNLIPIVGNIVNGVSAYFNKKQDVDLEKYKVKGTVDVEAMRQDTEIIRARADLAKARIGRPEDEVARILIMWPGGLYFGLNFYYYSFANKLPEWIMIKPLQLPESLVYVGSALMAFLFITAWKR